MAVEVSIDWGTSVITVLTASLTLVQAGPPVIREMNIDEFRLALKDWEDNVDGIGFLKTHNHNTEVTVAGTTLARTVVILDPYTVTFQDGQYAVNVVGANSNISEKANVNQVSIRSFNTAGLISVQTGVSGSGSSPGDIAAAVWDTTLAEHTSSGTTGKALDDIVNASGSGASPGVIAAAVWDTAMVEHTGSGTFGERVANNLLDFARWFVLKK